MNYIPIFSVQTAATQKRVTQSMQGGIIQNINFHIFLFIQLLKQWNRR